jgi:hypothetical protein
MDKVEQMPASAKATHRDVSDIYSTSFYNGTDDTLDEKGILLG